MSTQCWSVQDFVFLGAFSFGSRKDVFARCPFTLYCLYAGDAEVSKRMQVSHH